MKTPKLLFLSLAVFFISCGDDGEDPMPTAQALVGTWAVTAVDYKGTSTTTAQGSTLKTDFTGVGKNMNLKTSFASEPRTVSSEGSYTIALTTSFLGKSVTEDHMFEEIVSEGTWSLFERTLTVTTNDGPQAATIVELTSTKMKIKIDAVETSTISGITIASEVHATYTFKKQ